MELRHLRYFVTVAEELVDSLKILFDAAGDDQPITKAMQYTKKYDAEQYQS